MMNGGNSKFYKYISDYGLNLTKTIEERYQSSIVNYYMRRLASKSTDKRFKELPPPKNFKDMLGLAQHGIEKLTVNADYYIANTGYGV